MERLEYIEKSKRLEELLKKFTLDGELDGRAQKELDELSNLIQAYEEKHYPFRAESLNEMTELKKYQRKLKQN